jgi:tRNA-splicing ligase RtcB
VRFERICAKHPRLKNTNNLAHLGTLGTGNHFIELCLDQEARVWVMLHSGSRGVGNAIGTFFIELAKQDMRKWHINLPDQDLAYFPEGTDHFDDYVEAVGWAQDFAALNRRMMMVNVIAALRKQISKPFEAELEAVNCHHNYVTRENHFGENVLVTRKGRCVRPRALWASFRARWGRRALSCAGWATRRASTAAAMARGGSCRVLRRKSWSRSMNISAIRRGWNAARMWA